MIRVTLFGLAFGAWYADWAITSVARRGSPGYCEYLREGARICMRRAATTLTIDGPLAQLRPGALCVSNHASLLDIPLLEGYLPDAVGFVAKTELLRVPIVAHHMMALGSVTLDRSSSRAGLLVIRETADRLRAGHSMVLFPEGTRSHDGTPQPFKPGALKAAEWAPDAQVVPIAIRGTFEVLPRTSIFPQRPGPIRLHIGAPIEPDERRGLKAAPLADLVQSRIRAMWAEGK